jgi:dihydrofolate reductase
VIISLLVAMDEKRGIGSRGGLPWHISSDLKRFKSITQGHHIIMGRKTWESIGTPLPGRKMVVISNNQNYYAEGCEVMHSLRNALDLTRERGENEAFIIGGGQIFAQALPLADKIYLTLVRTITPADTYFPYYDPSEWITVRREMLPASENDEYATEFLELNRKR